MSSGKPRRHLKVNVLTTRKNSALLTVPTAGERGRVGAVCVPGGLDRVVFEPLSCGEPAPCPLGVVLSPPAKFSSRANRRPPSTPIRRFLIA